MNGASDSKRPDLASVAAGHDAVVAHTIGTLIQQSIPIKALVRTLFSCLASLALIWVAMRFFVHFEGVSLAQRKEVVAADAWMLIPVFLLLLPVILSSDAFGASFIVLRAILSPDQIGTVAIYFLLICVGLFVFWLLTSEAQSKRLFADSIRVMIGAAMGAAIQHRTKTALPTSSPRPNSEVLRKQ